MKTISTPEEIAAMKSRDPVTLECNCGKLFTKLKNDYLTSLKHKRTSKCRSDCSIFGRNKKKVCRNCQKEFTYNDPKQIFCSQSCFGTWNVAHKTHGTRRSKLEAWLEEQLTQLFPSEEIHFNRKDAIESELDIYFPERKIAFELNGIFHYEPIYGAEKLDRIQNNDGRKYAACIEAGIGLCVIDSSGQKVFKPKTSQKYLDIILEVLSK